MTNLALNFKRMQNLYPFLWKVWDAHNNFDEIVDLSDRNKLYHKFCNSIISLVRTNNDLHYAVCAKLVRNLKLFSDKRDEPKFQHTNCNNLNNWLYISIRKHNLNPHFFGHIFKLIKKISPNLAYQNECLYYFYDDNYLQPLSIVMLNIFKSNIGLIRDTLIGSKDKIYCSCQYFVYKMVKAYRDINSKYCTVGSIKHRGVKEKTCSFLRSFEIAYDTYLIKDESIQAKKIQLPALKPEENMGSFLCKPDDEIQRSIDIDKAQMPHEEPVDLVEPEFEEEIILPEDPETLMASVSIKKFLSTAIVTTSSVFFLFFLMYKFTPIGNMIRSKNRVKVIRNDYDADDEKNIYPVHNPMDINTYNQRYNIAYVNI
ncbi:variable surface protein [Plasmodium gonderi]|uniref:Variable surface protein n=1 Tax=Plasmodium gonderi TaxID=77519 RepID=A0A1Y1JRF8_PLAGO|nr:variable surface protein [Plasmodium gonderi]GAW84048.1 variable surface protein [Plasmodium gonderi]